MASARYAEKFENAAGSISYTFPLHRYEWASQQGLRLPAVPIVGQDYAYDMLRSGQGIKDVAKETIRYMAVESSSANLDAEIEEMTSELLRIGRGKLYTLGADGSTRRWAWARLASMPDITINARSILMTPAVLEFQRYSDWFASSLTTDTEVVTASGQEWVVNNPGNLPAKLLSIRLKANGSAGIINPTLTNLTNGYVFQSNRDSASADDEIKLDTEAGAVLYSTDNGASYVDDFGNYVLPDAQPALSFLLDPGDNTIRYTGGGTPSLDVVFAFYAPWSR